VWFRTGVMVRHLLRRPLSRLSETVCLLKKDIKQTSCREVAREFRPSRLWNDFRQLDIVYQVGFAVTSYSLLTVMAMWNYSRYAQRQQLERSVVRTRL